MSAEGTRSGVDIGPERQVIRGSGLIGSGDSGLPTLVDVKDGRITRIRPLNYEMKYDKKDFNVWKMEARGKTLEPPMRASLGPIGLAYKKRVYSKNRVRYPLKRVDWDPNGARGPSAPAGATPRTGARASTCASPGTRPPSWWPPS